MLYPDVISFFMKINYTMKITVFQNVTICSMVEDDKDFRWTCCLHLQVNISLSSIMKLDKADSQKLVTFYHVPHSALQHHISNYTKSYNYKTITILAEIVKLQDLVSFLYNENVLVGTLFLTLMGWRSVVMDEEINNGKRDVHRPTKCI